MNKRDEMISKLRAWCPECQSKLKIRHSYPFHDNTIRITIDCNYYSVDKLGKIIWRCEWNGIYMELAE